LIAEGRRAELLAPDEALRLYRDAAVRAALDQDMLAHNEAVERLLRVARTGNDRRDWPSWLASAGVEVKVMDPTWAILDFDRLLIASDYRPRDVGPVVRRDGWGVPLIGAQSLPGLAEERPLPYRALADEYDIAATAVARPAAGAAESMVLELHNPWNERAIGAMPLAADLTTPLTMMLAHRGIDGLEWQGFFNPAFVWPRSGVFMLTPYQPGKIPVLFVHGLWSSPRTWLPMINALQADPAIRERYQFWVAFYATGHSIPVSAWRMRTCLRDLRQALDPAGADPALGQTVVVTHSLGGLVGKLLVQESGDVLRDAIFRVPLDQLAMSPSTRGFLEEVLYFHPDPGIKRLIFIAVPHRGSARADTVDGRIAMAVIRRQGPGPDAMREVRRLNGPDVFRPELGPRPLSSVDNLREDEPLLLAFERMPRAPGVVWHSIVGIQSGRAGDGPEGPGDGVVSYRSAHIEGVPETIVEGQHIGLEDQNESIEEVRRHLYEHANIGAPTGPVAVGDYHGPS
jgi:pimeloyl-ACP methyl ester carboxylesterase